MAFQVLSGRIQSFKGAQPSGSSRGKKNLRKWPHKTPTAEAMARAGFYFKPAGKADDLVFCFLCNKELDGWQAEDDPLSEHLSHAPNCGFAMAVSQQARLAPLDAAYVAAREATYKDWWPHQRKRGWRPNSARKMAEAGFHYAPTPASDDMVNCACCGLGLDGWEAKDDPMEEHRRRNADCEVFAAEVAKGDHEIKEQDGGKSESKRPAKRKAEPASRNKMKRTKKGGKIDVVADGEEASLTSSTSLKRLASANDNLDDQGPSARPMKRRMTRSSMRKSVEPILSDDDSLASIAPTERRTSLRQSSRSKARAPAGAKVLESKIDEEHEEAITEEPLKMASANKRKANRASVRASARQSKWNDLPETKETVRRKVPTTSIIEEEDDRRRPTQTHKKDLETGFVEPETDRKPTLPANTRKGRPQKGTESVVRPSKRDATVSPAKTIRKVSDSVGSKGLPLAQQPINFMPPVSTPASLRKPASPAKAATPGFRARLMALATPKRPIEPKAVAGVSQSLPRARSMKHIETSTPGKGVFSGLRMVSPLRKLPQTAQQALQQSTPALPVLSEEEKQMTVGQWLEWLTTSQVARVHSEMENLLAMLDREYQEARDALQSL